MKYIVYPRFYRRGYCRTVCKSESEAISEKKKLEVITGFEWEIMTEK